MMLKESFTLSIQNILNNKMRSFLTMLGIIIGVTAIIALITIISGVVDEVTSQFNALGAGKIRISVSGTPLKRGMTEADMAKLSEIDNVNGVSPSVSLKLPAQANGILEEDVSIEGRNEVYFTQNTDLMAYGRGLSPVDMDPHIRVCVINQDTAKHFFMQQNPLGESMVIGGIRYQVIGVLSEDDGTDVMSQMSRMMGGDSDYRVVIPYRAALRMTGQGNITSAELYMANTELSEQTIEDIEQILNQAFNFKDDAFSIINLDSLLETMNAMLGMMTTMLAGIAAIALLVGGIGIMNMMLVSVTERTTEIGLRKALGAKPARIQMQFLMESIVLSVLGGLIGILLGNAISYVASVVVDYTFKLSMNAIMLGFGFSACVGILFGWAPANKASRLNPIDALRSM